MSFLLMCLLVCLMASIIDVKNDTLVPINQLVRERLDTKVSPSTIWRWRTKGVRGVKLEVVYARGCWCTTQEAFAAFLRDSSAAKERDSASQPAEERSPETERRLKDAGLLDD